MDGLVAACAGLLQKNFNKIKDLRGDASHGKLLNCKNFFLAARAGFVKFLHNLPPTPPQVCQVACALWALRQSAKAMSSTIFTCAPETAPKCEITVKYYLYASKCKIYRSGNF